MIKLVIFDLDGVLIDTSKELHYKALNLALEEYSPNCIISKDEHDTVYNALSTKQKLNILSDRKNLDSRLHEQISKRKQEITFELLKNEDYSIDHIRSFNYLKKRGIKIAICTNSIKRTTDFILNKIQVLDLVDLVITNEDVVLPKPNSEIYTTAINYFNLTPNEVLIFEDSEHGIKSAIGSGSFVKIVKDTSEVTCRSLVWTLKSVGCSGIFDKVGVSRLLSSKNGDMQISIKCPVCGIERFTNIQNIKQSKYGAECYVCSARKQYNPEKKDKSGYRLIPLFVLNDEDRLLCESMTNATNKIREHRLIMARHLKRPLEKHEIVHHINGNKTDNNLENLALLTTKSHHPGYGDVFYQKWQESLTEIERLNNLLKFQHEV